MDDGTLDSSTRANSGCMTLQCLQTACQLRAWILGC